VLFALLLESIVILSRRAGNRPKALPMHVPLSV